MINQLSYESILAAAATLRAEAARDGRDMALAVTDEAGDLVFGMRTDGCPARVLRHSIRKAYTAAVMRRDTATFGEENRDRDKTLADWGDSNLTHLVGGVVIRIGSQWFGGVGVGGNTTERDAQLAEQLRAHFVDNP